MTLWNTLVQFLPFEWASYEFMRNALLAVLIVTPCFGLVGTMVIGNRMAFFSDVIGHSALTGIAIGVLLGLTDVRPAMIIFAILLAIGVNILWTKTRAASDTVIGVFSAFTIALGVAILSRGGSFNKYTVFLVGDILSITPREVMYLLALLAIVLVFWYALGSYLALLSAEPLLAHGRMVTPFMVKTLFSILVAIMVMLSIRWVGLLIINSLMILPAAAARLVARNLRQYTAGAIIVSVFSGISGLFLSYYAGTSSGATIVLIAAFVYLLLFLVTIVRSTR